MNVVARDACPHRGVPLPDPRAVEQEHFAAYRRVLKQMGLSQA
jgi:hypothetical protein